LGRRPGPAQTGRPGVERAAPAPFVLRRWSGPVPDHVVLVDDVVTTGSTLAAAAAVLRAAGCRRVDAVAVARAASRSSVRSPVKSPVWSSPGPSARGFTPLDP
jgi:predicted phosphoribosyltransferase